MNLKQKKYTQLDILKITCKVDKLAVILQALLVLVSAIIPTFVLALATSYLIDTIMQIFENKLDKSYVYFPLFLVILIIGIISVFSNLENLLLSKIKISLEKSLTPILLKKRAEISYECIENAKTLELIDRVTEEMSETFLDAIKAYSSIVRSIIAILSIFILLITHTFFVSIVIILFVIPLFLISIWAGKKNYFAKVNTRKYERRYSYYSDEILTNRESLEEKFLFGYKDYILEKYYKYFTIAAKIQLKVLLKTRITMRLTSISLVLLTIITSYLLINSVESKKITAGFFMGVVVALFSMVETLGWELQDSIKNITEFKEYMKDFTTFFNLKSDKESLSKPKKEIILFENLEFKNVWFKYPNTKEYILKGLTFKIEKENSYSFVGINGAGKTTIIKLLTKLYDDYSGEILINNKNLKLYSLSEIKSLFSIVYQDFAKYSVSIEENIMFGNINKEYNNLELNKIIKEIELDNLINRLENGKKTKLGKIHKNSIDISGGQWQKIAIARSLFSDAQIKILDEPVASLDPISENNIYKSFEKISKNKTTIMITHRLGSTKLSNKIFLINKGIIEEQGTHNELMALGGLYKKMFETQRKWYE